jgi:CO/xanthine dehydrogenase Mo-binding subunit
MSGHPPLPLARLAQLLHAGKQTTGAMVHAAFVGNWIPARFPVSGSVYEAPIDALALKQGSGAGWTLISRANVFPPPAPASNYGRSLYAPSGTLACVDVNPKTGEVTVSAVHTFLEAGRVVQPDLLAGQYQGGVAMGVGYALYEYLPPTVGGAGEGAWNLNRYRVAKWGDLPLGAITLKALDPVTPDEPARGIAEAVLCPVAPAIANAIAAATGKRFRSLPITPQKVREALGN